MITLACSKTYHGDFTLRLPALAFEPGRIYAVMGANGSGKSTFARLLAGVLPPDGGGTVWERAVSIGYLPQKCYAFRMSVRANLALGGAARSEVARVMQELRLEHLAKQPARSLSGGETARMALGRVLIRPFELVVLDEPAAAMDIESTLLSERAILRYREQTGAAVIVITHSVAQARRIADEFLFFSGGALAERGDTGKVLPSPETEALRQFLRFSGYGTTD